MAYAFAVELDGRPHDLRVAAEVALPERVAQERLVGAAGLILVVRERTAEHGSHVENPKQRRGRRRRGHLDRRRVVTGQVGSATEGVRANLREHLVPVAQLPVFRLGEPVARDAGLLELPPDVDERRRVLVRQRPEQHGVDGGEDRRVRANPERERQNGDDGEAAPAQEGAQREADVLEQCVHGGRAQANVVPAAEPLNPARFRFRNCREVFGAERSVSVIGRSPRCGVSDRLHSSDDQSDEPATGAQ